MKLSTVAWKFIVLLYSSLFLISPPSDPQDTCVALQALAEYAILSYVGGVNLTISLASTNLDYQETFELNKMNKKVLQTAVVGGSVQADFQST